MEKAAVEVEEEGLCGGRATKHLTKDERKAILMQLVRRSHDGWVLEHGAISQVAGMFNVSRQCVSALWRRGLQSVANGSPVMIVDHQKHKCGRKKINREATVAALQALPVHRRTTIRATAHALGVSQYSIWKLAQDKGIKKHTNSLKPTLTDQQKNDRIDYCIRNLDLERDRFNENFDVIHVDEKWFYMKKINQKFYLGPGEAPPLRTVSHKSHIQKVMFLVAVARPRLDPATGQFFDGKVLMYPFTHQVAAQRASRNRPRGTLEWKCRNINMEVYQEAVIDHLLPAINEKWPVSFRNRPIRIQQDNARPHNSCVNGNQLFQERAQEYGLDIMFDNQLAQSPDTNVLDLGYFASLQSLQQQRNSRTIEELQNHVIESYNQLDHVKLNKVFLTHQTVMAEILLNDGGNDYKIPHLGKDRLTRSGQLPVSIPITTQVREKIYQLRPHTMAAAGDDTDTEPEENGSMMEV